MTPTTAAADAGVIFDPGVWLVVGLSVAMPAMVVVGAWAMLNPASFCVASFRAGRWCLIKAWHNPGPWLLAAFIATTGDWWPYELRIIRWAVLFLCALAMTIGASVAAIDAVATATRGPVREQYWRNPDGTIVRTRRRVKIKRKPVTKLDKAVRDVTPARNRLAYSVAKRAESREAAYRAAGVVPPPRGRIERKLIESLPTKKAKRPKKASAPRGAKKAVARQLDAEMDLVARRTDAAKATASRPAPPAAPPAPARERVPAGASASASMPSPPSGGFS